jgi:hypothetical protein
MIYLRTLFYIVSATASSLFLIRSGNLLGGVILGDELADLGEQSIQARHGGLLGERLTGNYLTILPFKFHL